MTEADVLDDVYERLHQTGPEFDGWLSNHGPMAADALIRLGHGGSATTWADCYAERLEPVPQPRWPIAAQEWRDVIGDPSRLGDWCALLGQQVRVEPWEQVLTRWWPRLLPGAVASAAHGLIRTGHAVRALREQVTAPRLDELGQALGYWAARWQPLPAPRPSPPLPIAAAFDAVPAHPLTGGIRARLAQLDQDDAWLHALGAVQPPPDVETIPGRIDQIVDAAVTRYGNWGHAEPVMLVHAATAPRAVGLVLPVLPRALWPASYQMAWAVTAAVTAAYRPAERSAPAAAPFPVDIDTVVERAVASSDAHALKFTEVAMESHRRGNTSALTSAALALTLIDAG